MGAGVIVLNMPDLKGAGVKLDEILNALENINGGPAECLIKNNPNITAAGEQRAKGQYLQIPAIKGKYQVRWVFDKDIYITGIRYSQSAWMYQDCWDLRVGDKLLYETVFTKEVGEYKHFNRFELVPAGAEIIFELANNSRNSRDLWVDLEYLAVSEATEANPEPPEDEPQDELTHDYDYKIEMNWESPSETDIDLWMFIARDKNRVCGFVNREYAEGESQMWLDFDYTSHIDNSSPEISTVLGFGGSVINIQVNNYNSGLLTEDITLKLYNADNAQPFSTIIISRELLSQTGTVYVCDIDIDTGSVVKILAPVEGVGEFSYVV